MIERGKLIDQLLVLMLREHKFDEADIQTIMHVVQKWGERIGREKIS